MTYSDYIIYVDESGDHGLDSIDSDYPVFVLDFCIFRKDHYANAVVPKVQAFKFLHFGHDMVVLHEHEIRKQKPPFAFLQSQQKRAVFMDGLNQLIEQADFTVVAAVIDKHRLTNAYHRPANPYELALCFCMMQPEQLQCEFSQSIVVVQGNQRQRVATASFSRVAGQSEVNAVFTLPHGVSLPNPVRVLVNDKEVGTLAWQTCDMGGCYASGQVDKAWLQAMRAGKTLSAALKARDGSDLSFSFQLNGFTKTEGMLP